MFTNKKFAFILLILFFVQQINAQNSVSATYTAGDIPTSAGSFDPSCNGNNILLSLVLPAGESYTVTGININYSMTAQVSPLGSGLISQQRSQVKCVNTNLLELPAVRGSSNSSGTESYSRTGVSIANGTYPGGTRLDFEMHAFRTAEITPGCNSAVNKVDNRTWQITVFFGAEIKVPKVGINTSSPQQSLELNGKLKLSDDAVSPQAGTIRWNSSTSDFEGYNGSSWLSLTKKENNGGWGIGASTNENGSINGALEAGNFGRSVAINGNYAIIGSILKMNPTNTQTGAVYIFEKTGTDWIQQAVIFPPDPENNAYFGNSVDISGEYAIIGSQLKNNGPKIDQGKAYIYKRNGTTWELNQQFTAGDGSDYDLFGISVSISGNYAIIGANGFGNHSGKAYVYFQNGTSWQLQTTLSPSANIANQNFGIQISISGDYCIVGTSVFNNLGLAYIFRRSGTSWLQEAVLTASDGTINDNFGRSVAINGNLVIIGAQGAIGNTGKSYIFSRVGNVWSQEALLQATDAAANDYFGYSVAISGYTVVIGSFLKDSYGVSNSGKAYIFTKSGSQWIQQALLMPQVSNAEDYFGGSVSIDGNEIFVGAFNAAVGTSNSAGKVFYFRK